MFRWEDMLVILAVGLILFGPNKLVDFAKSLGTAFTEFKKAANPEGQQAAAPQQIVRNIPVRTRKVVRKPIAKKPVAKAKAARA